MSAGQLDRLESLAIDPRHRGDGQEGIGVDLLDHLEQKLEIGLARDHHQDLLLVLGVPASTLQGRHTPAQVPGDGIGNLLILLREDEHLDGLPRAGQVQVQDGAVDRDQDEAVDDRDDLLHEGDQLTGLRVRRDQQGRQDDEHVQGQDHPARRDVAVLVDDHRDDVRPARAASRGDRQADAKADEDAAHDDRHQLAVLDGERLDDFRGDDALEQIESHGCNQDRIDGLDAERTAQRKQRDDQQDHIDGQIGITDLYDATRRILDNGRETGHAAADQVVGDQKDRPSEDIRENAHRDVEIISDGSENLASFPGHSVCQSF